MLNYNLFIRPFQEDFKCEVKNRVEDYLDNNVNAKDFSIGCFESFVRYMEQIEKVFPADYWRRKMGCEKDLMEWVKDRFTDVKSLLLENNFTEKELIETVVEAISPQ